MPKYVIEREIPGAGKISAAELKAISQKSCGVLSKMGPQIQWLHSYVLAIRSIAYTLRLMKRPFVSMRGKAAFPPTEYQKSR